MPEKMIKQPQLMLTPKPKKNLSEKMTEAIVETVEGVVKAVEYTKEKLEEKVLEPITEVVEEKVLEAVEAVLLTKERVKEKVVEPMKETVLEIATFVEEIKSPELMLMKHTMKAKPGYVPYVDREQTLLLQILGYTEKARAFYTDVLAHLSLPTWQLVEFINKLFELKVFTPDEILSLEFEDVKALADLTLLGNVKGWEVHEIYNKLSTDTKQRIAGWLDKVYKDELNLTYFYAPAGAGDGVFFFEQIAKFYIRKSTKEFSKDCRRCLKLLRIVVILVSGCYVLKVSTLKMGVIWYAMICTMRQYMNPERTRNTGLTMLASQLWLQLMIYIAAEEMKSTVNFMGRVLTYAIKRIPTNGKEWLAENTGVDLTMDEKLKYLCWNKTLEVLADIPKLTEEQAGRMLSTYSLAISAKECFEENWDLVKTIKSISPIPCKQTIFDFIAFYRDGKEYQRRKENVYLNMEKEIESLTASAKAQKMGQLDYLIKRIEISYITYTAVLKLKVAFCPGDFWKGTKGCFIDPTNLDVNKDVINEVAARQYIKGSNPLKYWYYLDKYKDLLTKEIMNNPTDKYIEYFGRPRNVLLGIGQNIKGYMDK